MLLQIMHLRGLLSSERTWGSLLAYLSILWDSWLWQIVSVCVSRTLGLDRWNDRSVHAFFQISVRWNYPVLSKGRHHAVGVVTYFQNVLLKIGVASKLDVESFGADSFNFDIIRLDKLASNGSICKIISWLAGTRCIPKCHFFSV